MIDDGWQHFCITGSIRDYLTYCAHRDEELKQMMHRHGIEQIQKEDSTQDAGICRSNGTGCKVCPDGRI